MSNTGAPLNLPKPTSTSNTGQDMIELGNSLQAINDRIKDIEANIDLLRVGKYKISPGQTLTIDHRGDPSVLLIALRGTQASARGTWIASGYSIGGSRNIVVPIDEGSGATLVATSGRAYELSLVSNSIRSAVTIVALVGRLPLVD